MKKRTYLFIFSILMTFLFLNNISAKVSDFYCEYKNETGSDVKVDYKLDGNTLSLNSCQYTYIMNSQVLTASCKNYSVENAPSDLKNADCPTSINVADSQLTIMPGYSGEYIVTSRGKITEAGNSSCTSYKNRGDCENSDEVACVWNETKYGNYCNVDKLMYVGCGDAKDIPYQIPPLISFAVNFLKILTPIILIVISMISLLKALASSNEDEIKKAQKSLVRKIIAAVLVFFVVTIVQFVIMIVADSEIQSDENGKVETDNLSDCLNCFLNNDCDETAYYKTAVSGITVETPVTQINNTVDNYATDSSYSTIFYTGEKNKECSEYGYDGYYPKAVKDGDTCYFLVKTDKKIKHYTNTSRLMVGEDIMIEQYLYKANNKYYYWEELLNKYVETSKETNIVTLHYAGRGDVFNLYCNYPEDDYHPGGIVIGGQCHTLQKTDKICTYNDSTLLLSSAIKIETPIYYSSVDDKYYYWHESVFGYNYAQNVCEGW